MKLKITIIIPAYNVEKFITKALDSILNQKNINRKLYEVLIVNDGSIDNSEKIIKSWIDNNNVDNFFYYKKTNGNWGSVINFVKKQKLIKGEFVSILDADDYFCENAFENFMPFLNKNNDLVLSNYFENKNDKFHKTHVVFSKTKQVIPSKCHTGWSIPLCKFYKSQLFYKIPNLKEGIPYQDQILFHSFLLKIKSVFFINKHLGVYWVERPNSSTALSWNEKRIKFWSNNMNELISYDSPQINAYVIMMIWHAKKNMNKEDYKLFIISPKNKIKLKKISFTWLPFSLRTIAKLFFKLSTKNFLK